MKKIISAKLSGIILIIAMILLIIFHIAIITGFVPYNIVWGGQLDNRSSLFVYEGIALIVTVLFTVIIAMKAGLILVTRFKGAVNFGMWFIFAYFLLNVVGNLASTNSMEKMIFIPVTIIIALLAFRLAIEKE